MAGMPARQVAYALLDNLGIDALVERIADGDRIQEIADDLAITRQMIYQWVRKRGHGDVFREARRESAGALVDDAQDIMAKTDPVNLAVDREKVRLNTWIASRLDRETFGDTAKVNIGINLGGEFVGMMRAVTARTHPELSGPRAQDIVGSTQQPLLVPRNTSDASDT